MMDELVDVVDTHDVIIGTALKSVCHRDGLLHRGAGIVVYEDQSKSRILIQKRSKNKGATAGKLCLTGGHVGSGEGYMLSAMRELQEELFADDRSIELPLTEAAYLIKDVDDDYEFIKVFSTIHPGPFIIQEYEVESVRFYGIHELHTMIQSQPDVFTQTTLLVLRDYLHI